MSRKLKWTDVHDIAISLEETYPDTEILAVRFTDLWQWVQKLPDFKDDPEKSNEKILEAIQMAWLDERD
jgi:FeS assembly protein IscX